MKTFKDTKGNEWVINLTLADLQNIESYNFQHALHMENPYYINFFPADPDLFTDLLVNPRICFPAIWVVCKEQAEQREITNELEFAKLFGPRTINEARIAFLEELPPFFPEMESSLQAIVARYKQATKIADEELTNEVEKSLTDDEIRKILRESIQSKKAEVEATKVPATDG